MYVTLRAERRVVVLDGELATLGSIEVNAEPVGVVLTPGADRLFVASSSSAQVDEIEPDSGAIVRSWSLADQPRWLALHPAGKLFVGCALAGTLYSIDLRTGEAVRFGLPEVARTNLSTGEASPLPGRITGDLAVAPGGEVLIVPATFNDATTLIVTAPVEEGETSEGYGRAGRFNPAAVVYRLSDTGEVLAEPEIISLELDLPPRIVGAFPSSVALSPDGALALVTIEASDLVYAFRTARSGATGPNFDDRGFSRRKLIAIPTLAAPRAATFSADGRAHVLAAVDRAIQELDMTAVTAAVADGSVGQGLLADEDVAAERATFPSQLAAEVDLGRRLFHTGTDDRTSSPAADVSCSFCHFEGRSDGLTRQFEHGPRQTPSLAGPLAATGPFRWQGEAATVADSITFTIQRLMGGTAPAEAVAALAAYADWLPEVDSPLRESRDPCVEAGAQLFRSAEVGCSQCHTGSAFTDNLLHDLFGVTGVNTRSLIGISDSAPYLHDGSEPTLLDLMVRLREREMGDTSSLGDDDLAALVCYLRSL